MRPLSCLAAFAVPLALSAQTFRTDSLDAYMRREMTARRIPGIAVVVLDHDRPIFENTYGIANLETGTPVTVSSVFEIASLTKQFTSAAVMMLARDGRVRLDAPISTYIDGTPDAWRAITVRHLLTHTAGLPIDAIVRRDGSALLNISTRQAFDFVASLPMQGAPGEAWSYSDAGYFLLGMIIERASGQRYADFLQGRIFDPLGMRESSVLDRSRIVRNHVSVYSLRGGELVHWRRDWQYELPSFFGVFSSIGDLAKWDVAIRAHTLLADTDWRETWRPARLANGEETSPKYGFGWFLTDVGGHKVAEHAGASGTFLMHFIDIPLTIIVLTNLDASAGPQGALLAHGIASLLDPVLTVPRRPGSE